MNTERRENETCGCHDKALSAILWIEVALSVRKYGPVGISTEKLQDRTGLSHDVIRDLAIRSRGMMWQETMDSRGETQCSVRVADEVMAHGDVRIVPWDTREGIECPNPAELLYEG